MVYVHGAEMKMTVKAIGFEENKKCSANCEYMAWYQIGRYYFCDKHMKAFIDHLEDIKPK